MAMWAVGVVVVVEATTQAAWPFPYQAQTPSATSLIHCRNPGPAPGTMVGPMWNDEGSVSAAIQPNMLVIVSSASMH